MEGFWELKLTGLSVAVNYIGMIADWNVMCGSHQLELIN